MSTFPWPGLPCVFQWKRIMKTKSAAPSLLYQNLTIYPSDRRCHIFALHIEHTTLDEASDWILIWSKIDQVQFKLTANSKEVVVQFSVWILINTKHTTLTKIQCIEFFNVLYFIWNYYTNYFTIKRFNANQKIINIYDLRFSFRFSFTNWASHWSPGF